MNNASLTTPEFKMLAVGLSLTCSLAYAGTDGYLSTSTAAGYSEVGPTAVYAGQNSVQDGITARESARRRAEVQAAMQLLQEGRTAYQEGKYSDALEKYRQSWDRLPHAPATRQLQEFIRGSISDASIAVAIEYAKVGRYDDAEQLLLDVLQRDPKNARARKELSLLRDPVRNNPALTPEHVKDVDEVNRLLTLAWGYFDLGKYNEAYAQFSGVLKIDPYNVAARRGQEAVSKRRTHYYRAAYDSYRSKALAEVDALWEETAPEYEEMSGVRVDGGGVVQSEGVIKINEVLDSLRIARASFDSTPISDVVDFLRGEIRKGGSPININFSRPKQQAAAPVAAPAPAADSEDEEGDEEGEEAAAPAAPAARPVAVFVEPSVTISLEDSTLRELLKEVCSQATCVYRVSDSGINVFMANDPAAIVLETRTWNNVPISYLQGGSGGDDDEDGGEDEDDAFGSKGGGSKGGKFDVKAALIANAGVDFPGKSSATYARGIARLYVRNTPENLEAIDDYIREAREKEPTMVKVTTKFVEVTQENEEELSFDWVINPFSVSNNGSLYAGGVSGANSTPNRTYNDFVTSGGSAYGNNHTNNGSWPVSNNSSYASTSDTITQGLMTGGLRSGSGAITSSSMDGLVKAGSPSSTANAVPSPGILSLSGIYDSGSFQMIMRGLSQKKGVDVMSAPSLVITPNVEIPAGPVDTRLDAAIELENSARIEVVRRFVFPTGYDEPQIPSNANGGNGVNNGGSMSVPVAAPANPNEWGVEEVGLVMVVQINSVPERRIVKFDGFMVRIVDFEGFINYGSPIVSGVANQNQIERIVLTENRIDQPVFSRRFVNTSLALYDGYTVAIGGMIEDKVQKVEDKVPVFGDLPLIGRFFRSNAESHTRKNLTIFVTADIIDAMGKPVRDRSTDAGPTGGTEATPGLFPEDGLMP